MPLEADIEQLLTPDRPGSCHGNRQTNDKRNAPTLQTVLMVMVMCQYVTMCIAWWRRSRVSLEATERCHQASTCSNIINGTCLSCFFYCQAVKNGHKAKGWPLLTLGVWYIILMGNMQIKTLYTLLRGQYRDLWVRRGITIMYHFVPGQQPYSMPLGSCTLEKERIKRMDVCVLIIEKLWFEMLHLNVCVCHHVEFVCIGT